MTAAVTSPKKYTRSTIVLVRRLPVMRMRFAILAIVLLAARLAFVDASQAADEPVTLRMIVVGGADEAERLVARLEHGADFAALARAESSDPTAAAGGLLGTVRPSELRPELRDALKGVASGQVTHVVRLPTGFAVVRVEAVPGSAAGAPGVAANPVVAAAGAVKYTLEVGGLPEAEAVLREFDKPVAWDQDPRTICDVRRASMADAQRAFEQFFRPEMSAIRQTRQPFEVMQAHLGLAQLHAYQGALDLAIPQYEQAYQLARASVPTAVQQIEEMLGVTYLHHAGIDNDAFRAPGELCLIPPRPGTSYVKAADADRAIHHFLSYLQQNPDDLEVRWLLNLATMVAGTYPAGVPEPFLIPPARFASSEDVGRFTDVAAPAGLNVFATAGGVIVDDLAGSGRFDVVTSNFYSCGPLHYFRNNGDGSFTERAAEAGLSAQLGGLNILQTDYNNDGCKDILILRGGWEAPQRKSLLKNNCNGTFTDVTAASGLAAPATSTQTAAWVDVDNDGLLDLFVGNEDRPSQLFLNKGDGRFEDISHAAHVDRLSFAKGVAAADYDNDGFADLYVSNYDGTNFLYHNNHDRTFTEVAAAAGVPGSGRGFGTWFFDYDNDGWLDLFVTSYFMSVDETARTYLTLPHNAATLKLYRNLGNGTFRDVTSAVGLDKVYMPMGANFGDLDNDGYLDMYLGMGSPSYAALAPHVLLRNNAGRSFVDVTASSGTGEVHKGHGVAFADLDNDGDEDIVAEVGGATPGDSHAMRLFENPGHGNDWLSVALAGVKSNRAAIGARIKVTVQNDGRETRSISRSVGSGGSFGASPLEQHIGLGHAARIVDLEIWWPTSNTKQHFSDVEKNQVLEIREFASDYKKLNRKPVRLGDARRSR
jgi:tetratricopeptide (TPR) repeat protein